MVNRLSRNGNGHHLYLKNTYKSTNQRRNSIQNVPTWTKLGKPKTDPTMVILVAFYILLTHICSALCLIPRDQFWRSNAFSPCQELPISGQHESDFSSAGCWHIHNQINTTTKRQHVPKKHIRKNPIFLTLTITKKDGSNVHQAGPLVRRRTNVSVVLIILQLSYTIKVRIGKFLKAMSSNHLPQEAYLQEDVEGHGPLQIGAQCLRCNSLFSWGRNKPH